MHLLSLVQNASKTRKAKQGIKITAPPKEFEQGHRCRARALQDTVCALCAVEPFFSVSHGQTPLSLRSGDGFNGAMGQLGQHGVLSETTIPHTPSFEHGTDNAG